MILVSDSRPWDAAAKDGHELELAECRADRGVLFLITPLSLPASFLFLRA